MLSARPISFNGDVDAQQQPILNAKTPGRRILKGRSVLQENALHNGAKTVLSKKNILQTPFRPGTAHAGKKPLVSISVTRPLMDKTPFPNRIAAASFGGAGPAGKTPGGTKLSKLALLISEPQPQQQSLSPDVAPLLRPSSARKSLRGRLSGSNFKTPLTKGNYWDVSPGDVDGIGGVAEDAKLQTKIEMAVAVDDEDDEIEYMPPTAVELPYEPPFEMHDYKAVGRALFALGHGGLMDDTADVYYAMDIEQQVDIKKLCADAGFTSARSEDSGLWLPELEDDSPFAQKPKSTSGSVPVPPSQAEGRGMPPASKSASSIPLVRTTYTRTSSSRMQPTSTVPARPATTTPPNQSRPTSASSSRLPQPTIVVAPGQTRTSALRAAKTAAAAAASAGLSAPKANPSAATRRAVASAPSSNPANISAGGGQTQPQPKTRMQAQAPPTHSGRQAKVQAQTRAPGETGPITIARSVTSGAISANANAYAYAKTIMSTGTGASASAGTGTTVAGASTRARSATVMTVNANARALGGLSGVKGTGVRGAGGKVKADRDGESDELVASLEKAIGDGGGDGLLALGGTEDFVFDV